MVSLAYLLNRWSDWHATVEDHQLARSSFFLGQEAYKHSLVENGADPIFSLLIRNHPPSLRFVPIFSF